MAIDIPFAAGANKPPTSLDFVKITAGSGSQISEVTIGFGAKLSAIVTSATLTEVLNISGSGFITFAALINATASSVTDPKIKIVIDGNDSPAALDESSGTTITGAQMISIVGVIGITSGSTEARIDFGSSIVISIAGDGTNGVALAFKRVLT